MGGMKVKFKDNERGGALLMVLMLVVIFTILGVSLLSMNTSASKQFDKKEEQVQARHQAEMGILHYKAEVNKLVQQAIDTNDESIDSLLNNIESILLNSESDYEVEQTNVELDSEEVELRIDITSKGKSKSSEKEIEATIIIETPIEYGNRTDGGGKHDPPIGDDVEYKSGGYKIPEGGYFPAKGNLHIDGHLDAESGKKDTNLTVEKDLYITGNIVMNNHTCIVVKGNLTILGDLPNNFNAHIYLVVYGDAYFGKAPNKINSGGIFIMGNVTGKNLGNLNRYKKPLPSKANCANIDDTPQPTEVNWKVQPLVSPLYK